ncbi:hypothetical protein [Bythopirellula goksoeyrii]|uniref:PEP-CTERM protein-sorting domain-containing protein n=1 Tax=Bythopirellula goksoeyrii TaxID=1400387 RepID=A0A5B9Q8U1_9BACT|nr:hypothetical protein [Bythopirellula goksoeyrii]QEG35407.1 hypothetical protein Pr1d_27060 [Bythopirellula goksoeyrii]
MKRSCLLELGIILICLTASSSVVFGQIDNSFQPTGTATWNLNGNWSDGTLMNIPSSQFDERAVINSGGTAFVDVPVLEPGAILLGSSAIGSGHLEVRSGGDLKVNVNSPSALQNGGIIVGGTGTGSVTVLPGGSLEAAGPLTTGTNSANLVTVGSASAGTAIMTVGSASFSSNFHTFSNANFSSNDFITFNGSNSYTTEISGSNSATLNATNAANLGGSLHVNFAGAPTINSSWPLLEASAVNGNFSSLSTNASLTSGQNLFVSTTSLGGGRERLDLNLKEVLVLQIDRNTGTGTITQPGGSSINLDGYSILSSQGSLVSGTWNSLATSGGLGGGWTESNPSATNLSELKAAGSGSLGSGSSVSLGSIYNPFAGTFGPPAGDISFEYTTPGGEIVPGLVEITGTFVNNLILHVDPNTGKGRIRNLSSTAVDIDGYVVNSASSSLTSGSWDSLDDQNSAGGEWLELLNVTNGQIGEVDPLNATRLGPGGTATLELGNLFNTAGSKDLVFQFLQEGAVVASQGTVVYEPIVDLTGDFNVDGRVDSGDFLTWQRGNSPNPLTAGDLNTWRANYGNTGSISAISSVPEPSSILITMFLASATMLSLGRFR